MKELLILLLCMPMVAVCQNKKALEEKIKKDGYSSSIGWEIKKGDTLQLGGGSMPNNKYAFIYRSPVNVLEILSYISGSYNGVRKTNEEGYRKGYLIFNQANQAIVKNIFVKATKPAGYTAMARVGGADMLNYWIELDNAVESGEILAPGGYRARQRSNNIQTTAIIVQNRTPADTFDKLKKLKELFTVKF